MARRQRKSTQGLRPTFERLEPRHMLSLSAALTEASIGLLVEPRTLQTPLRSIELPHAIVPLLPPIEQPFFVEPLPPPSPEPEVPQQVDSVLLALHGDGFFVVEGRRGQQLYTRVGDFLINDQHELVTKDGLRLLGFSTSDSGEIVFDNLAPLVIPYGLEVSQNTTMVKFSGVLNPSIGIGEGTSTDFVVYDERGNEIALNITAILSAKNADSTEFLWTVNYAPDSGFNEELGSGTIAFGSNGDLIWRAPQNILVGLDAGEISIQLDFSQLKALGETDAQGTPISSLHALHQDGFPPGLFRSFIILGSGEIAGQFTNGMQRPIGQLQLAVIPNPHGLRRVGEDLYALTATAGQPVFGNPGFGSLGSLTHLPPNYTVTKQGHILRKNESPPEHSSSTQPSPRGLRYPWQLRSVNLKIEGQELFTVEGRDGRLLYTRDGRFHLNAQQQLVTHNGLRVLGIEPDGTQLGPLTIPLGQFAAKATDIVQFTGNLNPRVDVATTPGVIESNVLGDSTWEIPDLSGTTIEVVPASAGQSGLIPGTYRYYFTYYDSTSNIESRPVAFDHYRNIAGSGQAIQISGLPQSTSANPLSIRVYRNLSSNSEEYHRIAELPNGTTGYLDGSSDASIVGNPFLNREGQPASIATRLVDVTVRSGEQTLSPFELGELTVHAERNGHDLTKRTLAITSETTISDLISFLKNALMIATDDGLLRIPGVYLVDGRLQIVSNLGRANELSIELTGFFLQPEDESLPVVVPFLFSQVVRADGPGSTTEYIVYDSQGIPAPGSITTYLESRDTDSVSFRWIATSARNSWEAGASTVLGSGLLTFNAEGQIVEGEVGQIQFQPSTGAPQFLRLDFRGVTTLSGTDARGNPLNWLNVVFQDGFPPGALQTFSISETGEIIGHFAQGLEKTLGQLQLAKFRNPFRLRPVGHKLLVATRWSGQPEQVTPGDPGVSSVTQVPPTIHKRHFFDHRDKYHGGRTRFRHLRSEQQPDVRWQDHKSDPLEIAWSSFRRVFRR